MTMSTGAKAGIAIVAIAGTLFVGAGIIAATSYIGAQNYGARVESTLKGARDNNKNILAQYHQKIGEAAQVPEMYKNDFKEIVTASMEGRYGKDGSKATFQWLKEHDIKIDSSLYAKIQNMIEGGRKDFELGQTRMIDIRIGYEAELGTFWRGMWLRIVGYPKLNMADYNPVTTAGVETAFKDGKETGPLKLR